MLHKRLFQQALNKVGIYAIVGFTDMRKQITGLASILYDITEINLQDPNIFILWVMQKRGQKPFLKKVKGKLN